MIRKNNSMKGTELKGMVTQLNQYADDCFSIIQNDAKSIETQFELIDHFCKYHG